MAPMLPSVGRKELARVRQQPAIVHGEEAALEQRNLQRREDVGADEAERRLGISEAGVAGDLDGGAESAKRRAPGGRDGGARYAGRGLSGLAN